MDLNAAPIEPTLTTQPHDLKEIEAIDAALAFPGFTPETAWTLGNLLRARLLGFVRPCVIDISLANNAHCLFRATTHSGTAPDNDHWVIRKRNTVLRFGLSTWYMRSKFDGDETAFAEKYALGTKAGEYAIHGGGWPVKVRGVEGVVAVIVVSGLKQDQDHAVIVQTVGEYLETTELELAKKKED